MKITKSKVDHHLRHHFGAKHDKLKPETEGTVGKVSEANGGPKKSVAEKMYPTQVR